MGTLPLHPALVHLPLGLSLLLPLFFAALAFAAWRGRAGRPAWAALVALQALLVLSGLAALRSGEAQEDAVERRVPKAALEAHEAAAQTFVAGAALTLLLAGLGVAFPRRLATATALLALGAATATTGLALRTGHAGGELVYVHGAAQAYVGTAATPAAAGHAEDD